MRRGVRRDLLLLFAFLADVRAEVSLNTAYKRCWWPEYQPDSLYTAVSRMVKVGELGREVDRKGNVILRLRARGGWLLDDVLPLRKLRKRPWDKKWRLVIFDIPEKTRGVRDGVREKLKQLGFGMWQKSVYVTPHDVMNEMNEYLENQVLFPSVVCFESQRTGFGSDREFANEIFFSEKRNLQYLEIVEQASDLEHLWEEKKLAKQKYVRRVQRLWERFRELEFSDPFLPQELLPKEWYAESARKAIRRIGTTSP